MKQKAQTVALKKTNGAQDLLNFVRTFIDNYGRFPKLRELPVKEVTVIYHFDSYEALLRMARVGERGLPLRKNGRKKRYCRYCGKLLPRHRWFFCEPIEHGENTKRFNHSCEEKYAEKHSSALSDRELREAKKRVYRKMWHKCKNCKETCKVYLPKDKKEPPCVFICKADPEYEEINAKFSNSL